VADLGGSGAGVETDQGEELLVWSRYYCAALTGRESLLLLEE
jgi:hypothetical protein